MLHAKADPLANLLRVSKTHHAMVEVTTECNLRCSYCQVSSPEWFGRTHPDEYLRDALAQLLKRDPHVVHLHGHGETTIVPNWQEYAKMVIDAGVGVSICSNLNKAFTDEEIDLLSRFTHLAVSIDTINPEMFKSLRRGGDVRQVTHNLLRIMTAARINRRPLRVSFSIVVCDVNIDKLLELTHYAALIGINGMTFCNLGVNETPKNAIEVKHISQLPVDRCIKALSMFNEIRSVCAMCKITCDLKYGIIDSLKDKIMGTSRVPLMVI